MVGEPKTVVGNLSSRDRVGDGMCLLESRSAVSVLSGHGSFEKTWTLSSLGRQMIVICILQRILTESDKLRTKKRISTGSQQKAVLDDPGSLDARPLSSIGDSVSKSVNTGPSDHRLGRARSLFFKGLCDSLMLPRKEAEDTGVEPATHCWAIDFESTC